MVARKTISLTPSCSPHQITPRSKFSLKSDKVDISWYGGHFGKRDGGSDFFSDIFIMFATSKHPKISIFIAIGQSWQFHDMAAILKKNGGSEKNFNSTIIFASRNTTCSSWNYLSSYYTFRDITCQSWKIRKNNIKRAITPTSFHGSSRKSHSR